MFYKNVHDSLQLDKASKVPGNYHSIPFKLLEQLTNHQTDVLMISDRAGNILFISDSIKELLGYDAEVYFAEGWKSVVSTEAISNFNSKIKKYMNRDSFTFMHQLANGQNIQLKCFVDRLTVGEQDEELYVVTIQDVTRDKEIEELMVRAEKMSVTGQLAAGIAHEIRNPLTAIKGFLQLLQSGIGDKEAYFRVMVDEIEKIETITSELLFLAKPMSENLTNYAIYELVADVVMLFQPQARQKGIQIMNDVDKEVEIYCDSSQIKQIFINLVKNALEEMNVEGTIYITSAIRSDFLQVDVIDEGPGIFPEEINKINEPFFTTKEEGTGLGLVITKQILERHNGTLHVFPNKQVGSTFRILLPMLKQY